MGRSRALRFRTCQAPRGGLGHRWDPGPPWPADLGAELLAGSCRRTPSAARLRRPEGKGAQPSTWRGAGRRTWGPLGARLWAVSAGSRARPGPKDPRGGCVPPPPTPDSARPASGQLTWAPRRRLPRSAPPARLGSAPLGPVRLSTGGAARASARARRGGASGSLLIGQGPGVERACPPQPRPRAPGPAET